MYPELITLNLPIVGRFTITSFGVMMAIAFLAGYQVIRIGLRRAGGDEQLAGDVLLAALIGGIVGAKLYYVILNWPLTIRDPFGMLFSRAGLVWYGGFIGGALGVIFILRRRGQSVAWMADLVAPGLALSYAIGRIGCFLVGDDYGRPTDSWIGIAFPNGQPATTAGNLRRAFGVSVPDSIPDVQVLAVYPTQLFETAISLLIFLALWKLREPGRQAGWLFSLWLVLAGAERLAVEFFRAKDDRFLGALTLAQLISLGLIALGAGLMTRFARRAPAEAHG
jgi:phosphatidylglycerol:prolipoprotein diacylglycerol transferase